MEAIGRIFTAIALVMASNLAPLAHAAPAAAGGQKVATFGGTTVISGRNAAAIDVHLTTPAVWSGTADDVKIRGGGDMPGFILTQTKKSTYDHPVLGRMESEYEDVVISGARLPNRGVTKNLSSKDRTLLMMPFETVIKPGDYKLYLVADGSPVRVELTLGGLVGTTRINPGSRVGVDMKRLPQRSSLSVPSQGLVTAGDDAKLEQRGFIFDALVVELKDSPEGEFGSCVYSGKPIDEEEGDVVSYGPHCVGGAGRDSIGSSFHYTNTFTSSGYGLTWGLYSGLQKGNWTLSTWYRGTGTIGKSASFGFWLNSK